MEQVNKNYFKNMLLVFMMVFGMTSSVNAWGWSTNNYYNNWYTWKANVRGCVLKDTNRNSRYDRYVDHGLRGIRVELTDCNGNKHYATTNSYGTYSFSNIKFGQATIKIIESSLPNSSIAQRVYGTNPKTVNVNNCNFWAPVVGYVFGPGKGSVNGRVFEDSNKNNRYDFGDKNLRNVRINVRNAQNEIIGHARTNALGYYCISNVTAGAARVEIVKSTLPSNIDQNITIGDDPTDVTIRANCNTFEQCNGYRVKVPKISSISDATANEGQNLVHHVAMTIAASTVKHYPFNLANDSTEANDYGTPTFTNGVTYNNGQITVPAGVTAFDVNVPTNTDSIYEGSESYNITAGDKTATGTIEEIHDPVINSITNASVAEGELLVHTVAVIESLFPQDYPFSIVNDSAESNDYGTPTFTDGVTYNNGNITVPAGVTTFAVNVPTTDNNVSEGSESYTINIGDRHATGTITDDPSVVLSVSNATAIEGNPLIHTVNVAASESVERYTFTLEDVSTSADDYGTPTFNQGVTYNNGNITVPAGVTTFEATVPTTDNNVYEGTESYTINVGTEDATGTINDENDKPVVLSVTSDSEPEGADLVHIVTMSSASESVESYPLNITNNSTESDDYGTPTFNQGVTYNNGNITVPAGVTTFEVTVPTTDNNVYEGTESYTINVGTEDATGTINDENDKPVVLSVTSDSEPEGADLVHIVTMSSASESVESYPLNITNNSTESDDYGTPTFNQGVTYNNGNITVPAGVTTFEATVPTTDNNVYEGTESYTINVGTEDATGTINDEDDKPVVLSVTSDEQPEGAELTHHVIMSGTSEYIERYPFTLADVNTSADDYVAPIFTNGVTYDGNTQEIIVPAGVENFDVVVKSNEDNILEGIEEYNITVGDKNATGDIVDGTEIPKVDEVTTDRETEGAELTHTVTLSHTVSTPVSYPFALTDVNTSADDYEAPTFTEGVTYNNGNITVPAGILSFDVLVQSNEDLMREGTEQYIVSVDDINATGDIVDGYVPPVVNSVTSDRVSEGEDLTHTVELSDRTVVPIVYSFTLNDVNTSADDYVAPTFTNDVTYDGKDGTITVPVGVKNFNVIVKSNEDNIILEGTEEYNITVGDKNATGEILDGTEIPKVDEVTRDRETEGAELTHTVTLSHTVSTPVSYPFALTDVNTSADDYEAPTFTEDVTYDGKDGTITVPAGVKNFNVIVKSNEDLMQEGTEQYIVSVDDINATGDIVDGYVPPVVNSVTSDRVSEDEDLTHTVELSDRTVVPIVYSFTLNDVNTSADDYVAPTFTNDVTYDGKDGTITVPVGVKNFNVIVKSNEDNILEGTEQYIVSVDDINATGDIVDGTEIPKVDEVTRDRETEGAELTHTVTLSHTVSTPVSYPFALTDVNTSADDYVAPTFTEDVTYDGKDGTITVPAGVKNFNVIVKSNEDLMQEGTEQYIVSVDDINATGDILDGYVPPVVNSVTSDRVSEGEDLTHTVELSDRTVVPIVYSFTLNDVNTSADDDYNETYSFTEGVTYNDNNGTITVPVGVKNFNVIVKSNEDNILEGTEEYNITVGDKNATGEIVDGTEIPKVNEVTRDRETEGAELTHTVTLSDTVSTPVSYPFALTDVNTSADDYVAPTFTEGVTYNNGNITVPAGILSFDVLVQSNEDLMQEGTEQYIVSVDDINATGDIVDGYVPPVVNSVTSDRVSEGEDLTHTVELSDRTEVPVVYSFTLTDVNTSAGYDYNETYSFTEGVTYNDNNGTITVPVGVKNFNIVVASLEDENVEGTEEYNITVGDKEATGTIDNVEIKIDSISTEIVKEGGDLNHTVVLTGIANEAITYDYNITDYSTSSDDYEAPVFTNGVIDNRDGTITVPAGVDTFIVRIHANTDAIDGEGIEEYNLYIGNDGINGIGKIINVKP